MRFSNLHSNFIAVVIFVVFMLFGIVIHCHGKNRTECSADSFLMDSQKSEDDNYVIVKTHNNNEYYEFSAEYPVFCVHEKINKEIITYILQELNYFQSAKPNVYDLCEQFESSDFVFRLGKEYKMTGDIGVEEISISGSYINAVLDCYYFEGGAHGNNVKKAFCYDKQKKCMLKITDLPNIDLEKCYNSIFSHLKNGVYYEDVNICNLVESFSDFAYDGKVLTIYLKQGEFLPRCDGCPKVTLSPEEWAGV
ncbi:MAG: hypothetical protein J5817_08945 [Treponema sp.]|nr:hypothetical protein [Treponema sp.]